MRTVIMVNASLLVLAAVTACVSGSGSERQGESVAVAAGSAAGAVAQKAGVLELAEPSSIGGIVHEPCRPKSRVSDPTRVAPSVEVGWAAPIEGREALLGGPVPYAAYRCH